jgi:O-antigen biosynthesis protein
MNFENLPPASPASGGVADRVAVAGKFLVRGGRKFFLNGVSYGPFAPNTRSEPFPDDDQLARDFAHIRTLGFNAARLYELPTEAVLRAAEQNDLLLIIGIPWAENVDFLSDKSLRGSIEQSIRDAAHRFGTHPNVAAILVGNEIEKTLAGWGRETCATSSST